MRLALVTSGDKQGQPRPLRVKVNEAAALMNVHPATVRKLVAQELFTVIPYRAGQTRGVGKRYFLLTEEVEIYATQGEDALREHRAKKKRAKR